MMTRFVLLSGAILAACGGPRPTTPGATSAASDPLPSWHDGPSKRAIVAFVSAAAADTGAGRIAPDDRIAVFDNDGTLWAEQPIYFQLAFMNDRIQALAPDHPGWARRQPFQSMLEGDLKAALAGGEASLGQLIAATHSGMTTAEFDSIVATWIVAARHPRFDRPYTDLAYQPMLELLAFLRSNGFRTFIVSGGGVDFMRAWAEGVYGIPPEQTVGSTAEVRFEMREGGPVLVKEAKLAHLDDGPGKPVAIHRFIGRRPVLAFGNSDGDLQMLQWTMAGSGPRFAGIVHHTDSTREWAYDRTSHIGRLDRALDEATARGWTVVDMQTEWKRVFPFEP